ncbi:hypothetical protein DFH27DRAFT_606976 [Peziza echinospora]|nr:hypothetical protein DFH27DRAFT_606976 [Peziza echinospora]
MKFLAILALGVMTVTGVVAQNCGPAYGNTVCAAGNCCSQYGWCDTTAAHCAPATCLPAFSGAGSSCRALLPTTTTTSATTTATSYVSTIPHIDICGTGSGGISCPGVGPGGFFYRCCSVNGHCGPKNNIQNQGDYCGTGCQPGFGACDTRPIPPVPTTGTTVSTDDTCGPIVNKRCPAGKCCSGSNFCGTGADFCGAANWCQAAWGICT